MLSEIDAAARQDAGFLAEDVFVTAVEPARRLRWAAAAALIAALVAAAPLWSLLVRESPLAKFVLIPAGPYFWGADLAGVAADAPPVLTLRTLSRADAQAVNAGIPFTRDPVAAAPPFHFTDSAAETSAQALDCLTQAVYYESASEPVAGQAAVAQVVLNRVRTRGYPKTVCDVVHQGADLRTGCQFTYNCDGSLVRTPSRRGWTTAQDVAAAALNGYVMRPVGRATHYHTFWVAPRWNVQLQKITSVGAHIFYAWRGRSFDADRAADARPAALGAGERAGPDQAAAEPIATETPVKLVAPIPLRAAAPVGLESLSTPAAAPVVTASAAAPALATGRDSSAPPRRLAIPSGW